MLTRSEKFRLKQEFPEGIPPWMFERGYDANKIRTLMIGRRKVYPSSGDEHDFTGKLEDWENRVFLHASKFTVVIGRSPFGRMRVEYETFPEALKDAGKTAAFVKEQHWIGCEPMIYAVTESGRHVMLAPIRWNHYLELWNKKVETGK